MTWLIVGGAVVASALLWLLDAYLGLRKRVADLEQRAGTGKADRIADLLREN